MSNSSASIPSRFEQVCSIFKKLDPKMQAKYDWFFDDALSSLACEVEHTKEDYESFCKFAFRAFEVASLNGDEELIEVYASLDRFIDSLIKEDSLMFLYSIPKNMDILHLSLFFCPQMFKKLFDTLRNTGQLKPQCIHLYIHLSFIKEIIPFHKTATEYLSCPLTENTKDIIKMLLQEYPDYIFKNSFSNVLAMVTYSPKDVSSYLQFATDLLECGWKIGQNDFIMLQKLVTQESFPLLQKRLEDLIEKTEV